MEDTQFFGINVTSTDETAEMRFPDQDINISMEMSLSEIAEVGYQLLFFVIGTPLNIIAFKRTTRKIREGGLESRLVKLSRHLLIAHLLVLLIYGVWRSYWFYTIVWTQGNAMCKIYSFLQAFPFHLWSNLVAAIAVDMLCCITSPLSSYRNGSHRVSILIAVSWLAAIVCSAPMLVFRGTITRETADGQIIEQCYPLLENFSSDVFFTFYAIHVTTTFWLPLLIIVICYVIIGCSLRKQMSERLALLDQGQSLHTSSTKARFLKASVSIIATFFFTWLPYQVLSILRIVCDEGTYCDTITAKLNWLQVFIIASTCINPWLYRFGHDSKSSKRSKSKSSATIGGGGIAAFIWPGNRTGSPLASPGVEWPSTLSTRNGVACNGTTLMHTQLSPRHPEIPTVVGALNDRREGVPIVEDETQPVLGGVPRRSRKHPNRPVYKSARRRSSA